MAGQADGAEGDVVEFAGRGDVAAHLRDERSDVVEATLVAPKLLVEDGAFYEGDCRMGEPPELAASAVGREDKR